MEGIKDYILPNYLRSLKIKEKKPENCQKKEDRAGFLLLADDLTDTILEKDRACEKHFTPGKSAKSWYIFNVD